MVREDHSANHEATAMALVRSMAEIPPILAVIRQHFNGKTAGSCGTSKWIDGVRRCSPSSLGRSWSYRLALIVSFRSVARRHHLLLPLHLVLHHPQLAFDHSFLLLVHFLHPEVLLHPLAHVMGNILPLRARVLRAPAWHLDPALPNVRQKVDMPDVVAQLRCTNAHTWRCPIEDELYTG